MQLSKLRFLCPVFGITLAVVSLTYSQAFAVVGKHKERGNPCATPGSRSCGDPITIGTGNVFEPVTDYETAGPNKLGFSRY